MNNRVLGRKGARELTPEEAQVVTGTYRIQTYTVCTAAINGYLDGDTGEC